MEITKLDLPDDDGLLERLARLCELIDDLIGRAPGHEQIAGSDLAAARREALIVGFTKSPWIFDPFVPTVPADLN